VHSYTSILELDTGSIARSLTCSYQVSDTQSAIASVSCSQEVNFAQ